MTLEKYFHVVHNLLETHWAIDEQQVFYNVYSNDNGMIVGKIVLLDGSYIDFLGEVFVLKKMVVKGKYHYQFVKEYPVFRYDNYSRHSGITPPFHHKHTSQNVIQLEPAPKLIDVIEEAVRHMF